MTDEPGITLKRAPDFERLNALESRVYQIQLDQLKGETADHEKRIRSLEDTATKFNFLLYLTMGGGLVSIVNLIGMAFLIVNALTPK
jgi:hypothetical protein